MIGGSDKVKIERIVSRGHKSEADFWYEQTDTEFVLLLQGEAELEFEDKLVTLRAGDYLSIAPTVKHRISYTSTKPECIWLAVFY